jgi:hypothetical protein
MRLLFFSLLFSTSLFAQIDTGNGSSGACTRTTIANGGVFNCTTLDISGAAFAFNNGAAAAVIKVQGNVTINTSVSLEGQPGSPDIAISATVPGGIGGPGATAGGGVSLFTTEDGIDHNPLTDAFGRKGVPGSCGGGGGGGSFAILGDPGTSCGPSAGGVAGVFSFTDIPSPVLGGLGGGAGADGFAGFFGTGGGGGGAMVIMAGGDIIINGSISARGGDGGTSAPNAGQGGGGGGGGSGGMIVIKSSGQITNNAAINADGGNGGIAGQGGNGGNGGYGFVILEDADGIIDGIGTIPGYGETGTSISQRQSSKVTSDISCGMIKPKQDSDAALMQIVLGFMLAFGFGFLSKKSLKLFA